MANKRWFNPDDHTGWHKSQRPETRRRKVLNATNKKKTMRARYLEAGRKLQALANVTTDNQTHIKAKRDADYFFNKLR